MFRYHKEEKQSWQGARERCQEDEADLLRVDNPYEDQYIFRFAKENDIDVWLGNLENVCKKNC